MTINELLAAAGLTGDDVIPMYDVEAAAGTEPTQKIKATDFVSAMKTLGSLLSQSDVVNNLTSTAIDKPLSAAQGKALNDKIDNTSSWSLITVANNIDNCRFYKNEALKLIWVIVDARPGAATKQWTLPSEVPVPKYSFDAACWCMNSSWTGLGAGTVQFKTNREVNFTGLQSTFATSANALYPYS